jgi:adenosine deaminase
MLDRLARDGVALEVCPTSNVSLGVYSTLEEVPIRTLTGAGIDVALGSDDPLLFGSRLAGQYAVLRAAQDFTDTELAELARMSIRRSYAPSDTVKATLTGIEDWISNSSEKGAEQ